MSKTCIICGGATGSREHIFPAALGGRRTNKGIYCDKHNNAYSGLAGIIAEQLNFFNAQLGVVGDHATETRPVTLTDVATGQQIELTDREVTFKEPQAISETVTEGGTVTEMAFTDLKQAEAWVAEQRAKGFDVSLEKKQRQKYHSGAAHFSLKLGGDVRKAYVQWATSHKLFWRIIFLTLREARNSSPSRIIRSTTSGRISCGGISMRLTFPQMRFGSAIASSWVSMSRWAWLTPASPSFRSSILQ